MLSISPSTVKGNGLHGELTHLRYKLRTYLRTDNSLAKHQAHHQCKDDEEERRTMSSRISSYKTSNQSENCLLPCQLHGVKQFGMGSLRMRSMEDGRTSAMGLLNLHIPNISDSNPTLASLYSHNLHSIYSSNQRRSWGIVGVVAG
jgi:hypothetical protein